MRYILFIFSEYTILRWLLKKESHNMTHKIFTFLNLEGYKNNTIKDDGILGLDVETKNKTS
jgi:hypothetical protein